MQKKPQQCYCYSCRLYAQENSNTFALQSTDGINIISQKRKNQQNETVPISLIKSIQDTSDLFVPSAITKIHIQEITTNPIWFYKQFISKNAPVIILGALDGDQICERWANPSYIEQVMQKRKVSISLTPDGFADSIKSDYFIEPYSVKGTISNYLNHKQQYPEAIAYIQQQNNNLSQEMVPLQQQVPFKISDFLSNTFFEQKPPDAQNLWLGQKESVSSLHKDHYQNFYMPIVGEKHFTLIPPLGILRLQENVYKSAQWKYDVQSKNKSSYPCFTAVQNPDSTTRWIYDNPDLQSAIVSNKQLIDIKKFHVVVQSGEMLYLPSLWYHQVSQCHLKDPYCLSINYWYDMSYGPSYSLYQLCRAIRKI